MEIWSEIKNDEKSGAKRLVSEYGNRLFAAAVLLCKNDHDAEELVFQTFDQAIRKIRKYEPTADFFNWLYTIMLNFFKMNLRKKRIKILPMGSSTDFIDFLDHNTNGNVATEFPDNHDYESLWQSIHKLDASLREVIMLRYFAEQTIENIASTLEIPEGTVKSRLHKARISLYGILSKTTKNGV